MADKEQKQTFFFTDEDEDKMLGIIQSDAELKERCDVLREIGRVATVKSVEPMAALLGDEVLAHRARYALEMMPFPEVDVALRKAMKEQKGNLLAGIIMSLGNRRDTAAVDMIAEQLGSSDPAVALASAYALGDIGTQDAANALEAVLPDSTGTQRDAICEGLLRAAEAMKAAGWDENALAVYDRLRIIKEPRHVREAAMMSSVAMRS
ncbi:MAG: HEAT repeat domain-containing protein [Candidatus Omnitrophica bacterium]|nr:HEAT repeat domain-containing protein [Candidatus Omnitrophota bacterium]